MIIVPPNEYSVLPAWVSDYEEEYDLYSKGKKKWMRFLLISGLLLIIVSIVKNFPTFGVNYATHLDILLITSVIIFSYSVLKNYKLKLKPSQFLAGFLYLLGYTIHHNDNPTITNYVHKIDSYLKNVKSILHDVDYSIDQSYYVGTTKSYLDNLNEIIELCNEFAKHHNQYSIAKNDISYQLMNLGKLVRNDEDKVSDKHTNLTQLLIDDLKKDNLKGKAIQISMFGKIKDTASKMINKVPEPLKLISLIIFILVFEIIIIYYFGTKLQISNETLFQTAILGSITSISVIFLIFKNYLSKAKN